jgi:hypothetical protein
MTFEFLGLTPAALATLNAFPNLFVTLVLVIVGLLILGGIIFWVHYETSKPYAKPKVKKDGKK